MATLEKFKLSALVFDYDKDPKGFFLWLESMGGFVRSTEGGPELEDMLDSKLHRASFAVQGVIPSFLLLDPDFDSGPSFAPHPPSEPRDSRSETADTASATIGSVTDTVLGSGLPAGAAPSAVTGGSGATGQFSLGQHHTAFSDLPDVSKKLDAVLYNILRMNIKGSIASLLNFVRFPSYVQAICILVKSMDLSRLDRIMAAFSAFDKLAYTGDAMLYQSSFMGIKREMDSCQATMTDYIFCKLMRSFDGKSKTIQFKIAADYNALDPALRTTGGVNFYDLVQRYCGELAAVGDSNKGKAFFAGSCEHCGSDHMIADCPKLKEAQRIEVKARQNRAAKTGKKANITICDHCSKVGHTPDRCWVLHPELANQNKKPQKEKEKPAATNLVQDLSEDQQSAIQAILTAAPPPAAKKAAASKVNTARMSSEQLQAVVKQIREQSGKPVSMVKAVQFEKANTEKVPSTKVADAFLQSGKYDSGEPPRYAAHTAAFNNERIHLSLCDGMGAALQIMKAIDADITRCIGVEINPEKRLVCDNLNPPETCPVGGVDHSWHSDVRSVTREDIHELASRGMIVRMDIAANCEDFSSLRLLPSKYGKPLKNPRPGFGGKKGEILLVCIQIAAWVLEVCPDCEVFNEQIKFDDMPEAWAAMVAAFGEPLVFDSADVSGSRRVRAYGGNVPYPLDFAELTQGFEPFDPNRCMEAGRTLEPYTVGGKTTIRTIGKSWTGDPDHPTADTTVPVIVHDEGFEKAQELRAEEAEMILGWQRGSTAGRGASQKLRLSSLGDGWDFNTVLMINRFSRLARKWVSGPLYPSFEKAHDEADSQVSDLGREAALAELVSELLGMNIADVGDVLAEFPLEEQSAILEMMRQREVASMEAHVNYAGSVLDSGSGKHLQPRTHVLDAESVSPLVGFTGETDWTQGNGYLPVEFHDTRTDSKFAMDIGDSDKLSSVITPILSLGKMLRMNYKFHFEGPDSLIAIPPDSDARLRVELGDDDILRLPHTIRKGKAATPLPVHTVAQRSGTAVMAVHRTPLQLNSAVLHDVFLHRGAEKINRTLQNTKGYEPIRLVDEHCDICAKIKARRRGLSHRREATFAGMAADIFAAAMICPVQPEDAHRDADYDDADELDADEHMLASTIEYISPVAGRSRGEQPVPRFDLEKLRPFEVMFVDNKDYEQKVRGGRQVGFVLVCLKSFAKFKVDTFTKADNGFSFRRIVAKNGVHKLPWKCTVYSDGCGSMAHVEIAAVLTGIDHVYIPPREQSLNEAEKVCLITWDDAAALMERSKAPSYLFACAVSYAMYVDMRMSSTASRGFKTPFESIKGVQPSILKLHRFYTKANVTIPRDKRKKLAKEGVLGRAETGRFLGFQSIFSSTYTVLLTKNRLVNSINVTFDDGNFIHGQQTATAVVPVPTVEFTAPQQGLPQPVPASPGVAARDFQVEANEVFEPVEADEDEQQMQKTDEQIAMDLHDTLPVEVQISPFSDSDARNHFDLDDPALQSWRYQESSPQPRPRPSYSFLVHVEKAATVEPADRDAVVVQALALFAQQTGKNVDECALRDAGMFLALLAQKDMKWDKVLKGKDSALAIAAFHAERDSLLDHVLELITPDDPRYQRAVEEAISGRFLLDIRRSGMYKARGVKQGFKEDKLMADGEGFNYYSSVVKLYTVRIAFFRPNRGTRRVAILDERTAFLQSDKFPEEVVKFLMMWNPVTREREHFQQYGPLYGENSAPKRWEDTYAPFLESEGFERGVNERSVFNHFENDVLDLTWVDDNYLDAEEDGIKWAEKVITSRFECKEIEWVPTDGTPVDYLGMHLSIDALRTYMDMEAYIDNALEILGWAGLKTASIPISKPIDETSALLTPELAVKFHTAQGMLGWLSMTCRPDISYAHSRIGQHQSKPTVDALDAVQHCFRYLKGTKDLCLSGPVNSDKDMNLVDSLMFAQTQGDQYHWEFYCDSDFAGNTEVQNKRRSQNGYIALLNGVPVYWVSKVSSVCFASPDIGEAHATTSSAESEIFCEGNATKDFMHLGYVAREMGIPFPKPFVVRVDNEAARAFADDTVLRSKLKHIDTRQEWVSILRDKGICKLVHVPSADNLADILTKILPTATFVKLRDQLMHRRER
jgi:hypothetical protein